MPSIENRLDNVGCQQCQAQDPAEIGPVDFLGGGQIGDGRKSAAFEEVFPAVIARQGLDQSAVDARAQRVPAGAL